MIDVNDAPLVYARRPTRTVHVGDVGVGSGHPIRVQSMTTPSTQDTAATTEQIRQLVEAGCEIVRLTVPTSADAENLPEIRRALRRMGISVPLVADIHFTPAAALKAVEHVEKIRINPGNFADKKRFAVREYDDAEYAAELERIERVFSPLVRRARELGVSMRIGTNHGSLSDRIMNRFGDTPEGMVESALEFVRICEHHDYRELILSMKASNPRVVLAVYRLLARRMAELGMDYPFHLGVTEAGDGEDGRVKSAVGIGPLLEEGIGDTVRVSLTEDPVAEIPVARALVERFNRRSAAAAPEPGLTPTVVDTGSRRASAPIRIGCHELGGDGPVLVEVPLAAPLADEAALRREIDAQTGPRVPQDTRAEVVSVDVADAGDLAALERLHASLRLVAPAVALSARCAASAVAGDELPRWVRAVDRLHVVAEAGARDAASLRSILSAASAAGTPVLAECGPSDDADAAIAIAVGAAGRAAETGAGLALALAPDRDHGPLRATRRLAAALAAAGHATPIVLLDAPAERGDDPLLGSSAGLGGLLCEGIGDAVHIRSTAPTASRRIAFGILQAARVRITRTDFISCPSCGRTLFDLEETTARIKRRTSHLKGLKIAVMGCVVNGPGEMADADFGYVGWGEDKIALFVGKEMVARDVPTAEADERLVALIKQHGRWVDPAADDQDPAS